MIRSRSVLPDVGISAGIGGSAVALATATGAITRLNKMPVTLVKRKNEKIATGANNNERKRGNLRGNFILNNLQGYVEHKGTIEPSVHADSFGGCTVFIA